MQTFVMLLIGLVMTSDFIVQILNLPTILHFLPEVLSIVLVLYVFIAGTRNRFELVAGKYWIVFGALALEIVCGAVNSGVGSGPIITGLRFYGRAMPLFFVAAIMPMSEAQLRVQLKWLLLLSLLQVPVAAYQRWVIFSLDRYSGDDVRGTTMDSGILSMYLISAVLVLTGLMMKRRIGKVWYAVLFFFLLLPTTINETKGTVIFLPLGLLTVLVVGAEAGKRLRYFATTVVALIGFGAIFIPIYDSLEAHNHYKVGLVEFFTNPDKLNQYLVTHGRHRGTGIGGDKISGRGDAIMVPVAYLSHDPVALALGEGLGNASPSNIGKNKAFEGKYYLLFHSLLITSFSYWVLELGLLGVAIICVVYCLMFADCMFVARRDDSLFGAFAGGWSGVVALFFIGMLYNVFYQFPAVIYLFWFYTGLVCARRVALERQIRAEALTPVHPRPAVPAMASVAAAGVRARH